MTLRSLGDKGCHLEPHNIWKMKVVQGICNSTRNQVSHDHRSFERNLSNCEQKPEKVRTSTGFEPVTSRYRCEVTGSNPVEVLTFSGFKPR